jgi:ATP-dependent protease Clp ATPase subunit
MDNALRCSFCRKSQDVVGKLISSPSDYPRTYICDECIRICMEILEDDQPEAEGDPQEPHPLLNHPLTSHLLAAVEQWIQQESLGAPAAEELALVREIAQRLLVTR